MREKERRILIIDDCAEDRETYRRYLFQDPDCTYVVLEAELGELGLELCRTIQPDCVLLDYLLPDFDGLEFLNELKTQVGKIDFPIVMVTGFGDEAVAVQAMKNGAYDYLVKRHLTPESLQTTVQNALEKAELLRQLERSQEQFRSSVTTMLDCFAIYSAIRNRSGRIVDFRIEYVNQAACLNSQLNNEQQIGRGLCELMPMHRETGLFDEYCQLIETGQPLVREVLLYEDVNNPKKLTKAFDIRATKLGDGLAAAWRDITDRKQVEEQLTFQACALSQINDAVVITEAHPIDPPGPRIVYANQALARMTGYSLEEVLGRTPRMLQGPKTDRATLAQIRAAIARGQPVMVELLNYRQDGSEFHVELNIVPMANEAGTPTHLISVQRDISDRKKAEVEREQLLAREQAARQQAEEANSTKDQLLAIVSHELRSPLNAILGWSRLLQGQTLDQATTQRALETIERNAKLQSQLIEDLLDLERLKQGHLRLEVCPMDLATTVEAAINTVRPSADAKNIRIEANVSHSIKPILGDASRLQQVVGNLLTNAIKFTPEGGQVTVRLERCGSIAQIQVSDTGQGISAEFLPYVFEQFRQENTPGTNKQKGLGLGLAIVRRLVELHNGSVYAESEGKGKGATFTVRLPIQVECP